jgi:hypothetical protein
LAQLDFIFFDIKVYIFYVGQKNIRRAGALLIFFIHIHPPYASVLGASSTLGTVRIAAGSVASRSRLGAVRIAAG